MRSKAGEISGSLADAAGRAGDIAAFAAAAAAGAAASRPWRPLTANPSARTMQAPGRVTARGARRPAPGGYRLPAMPHH
jgi:hypothetical protein